MTRHHKLKMQEIAWVTQSPDCYGGDTCDQIESRWDSYFDGDKDSECSKDDIILDPKTFPPGTMITISVPECPECQESVETCCCGFDWNAWVLDTYS